MTDVAFINRSTVWKDAEAQTVMNALQKQVSDHFHPAWDLGCNLHFFGQGSGSPAPAMWWLVLLDNSDQATALGYHEMTSSGLPIGKSFLKTTVTDGGVPSVTTSHELLEMLADPRIATMVLDNHDLRRQRLYALEVCDACEDDEYAYALDGVDVSDFVYPSWFEGWRLASTPGPTPVQFDYLKKIDAPFKIIEGGYISYMDITGGGWQQLTADIHPRAQYRAPIGSRRERRRLHKNFWRTSTAHP